MLLVNYSTHPLNDEMRRVVEALTGTTVEDVRVVAVPTTFPTDDFESGIARLVDAIGRTPEQLQTQPLVVMLPETADIACAVIAELHGRIGNFPSILRWHPHSPEIVNLQRVRSRALNRRFSVE